MKKLFIILTVMLVAVWSYADLSESDYSDMTVKMNRLKASREVRAEFQGFIQDLKARRARLLKYQTAIGSGDDTIPVGYVNTATSFYQLLGTALNTAETNYKVFLTGDDGVDDE